MTDSDPYFETDWAASDLRRAALRGGTITLVAQGIRVALIMGATMVLARLLRPSDFGLVAMVAVVIGLVSMFKDMGLSMATVQREQISRAQVSTLFWFNAAVGVGLTLLLAALSPLIAWIYGEPRLAGISMTLGLAFLFGGLTVQHQALLRRRMQFGRLAAAEVGGMLFSVIVAIVAALLGAGYWALVVRQVALALGIAAGVWLMCGGRPGPPRRRAGVRSLLGFGGHLTASNLANYLSRNLDKALIGWRWGAEPLGFYSKAYQLLLLPIHQVNAPVTSVAIPTLSRLQSDPSRYRAYYRRGILLLVAVGMPVVALLCAEAQRAVQVLLGSQWSEAVPLFRVLAPAAFVGTFNVATGWVYISTGRTDRQMRWVLFSTALTLIAFAIGLRWGAMGVAVACSASFVLLRYPGIVYCFRAAPVTQADLFGALWRPAVASLSAAGLIWFSHHLPLPRFGALPELIAAGLIYGLLYLGIWHLLPGGRAQLRDIGRILREMIESRRPRKEPPAGPGEGGPRGGGVGDAAS
ncbi:MAG: oligosaccharide flippase family protein [Candidatus Eisenbacteria bacterium]|nr:oligosaccharide flippase family protein [Candidatus Eisenbacteria bacterium]